MLKAMVLVDQAKVRDPSARLDLVIVGGGASVELAVELVEASHVVSAYGLPNFARSATWRSRWSRARRASCPPCPRRSRRPRPRA